MKSKIIALALIAQIALSNIAYGQEAGRAVQIESGSPAPFTGTLLDPQAVAKIIADREKQAGEARALAKKLVEESSAAWKLEKANLNASHESDISILTVHSQILEQDLKRQTEIAKSRFSWTSIAVVGLIGTSLGILTTLFIQKRLISKHE